MGRSFLDVLVVGTLVLVSAHSSGCHNRTGGRRGGGGSTQVANGLAARTVATPLVSNVFQAERLKGINSLEIDTPVLPSGAASSLTHEDVSAMLSRTAHEVLTLKIFEHRAQGDTKGGRADGILKTEIVQYRDRQGSAIGGEPATVSFRMSVVSSVDRKAVWDAQYFYRQEPLSENLLKIGDRLGASGSGAGWISGHGLLQKGLSAALEDFSRRREQQFLSASR